MERIALVLDVDVSLIEFVEIEEPKSWEVFCNHPDLGRFKIGTGLTRETAEVDAKKYAVQSMTKVRSRHGTT